MRNFVRFITAWHIIALGFCLAVSTSAAALRDFDLLGITSAGEATGNGGSRNPVVSRSGEFIALASEATNLGAIHTDGLFDLIAVDLVDNSVTLASGNTFPRRDSFSGTGTSSLLAGDGFSLALVAQEIGGNVVRLPAVGTRFYHPVQIAPPRPGEKLTQ